MIFIADGGSTKADWRIIDNKGKQQETSTIGFNPFFFSEDRIVSELQKKFAKDFPVDGARKVYFYGSGCSDPYRCSIVEGAFQQIFTNAENILVEHDLLASAKATCGDEPGIACILGTGSNSALYNGKTVVDNITNLGHMLGDEGSGSYLGKMLIRGYFYREFPKSIREKFEDRYKVSKRDILNRIYDYPDPNVYLASFARFMSDNKDHLYIQQLVYRAFSEFIDRHVRKYHRHNELPVHFVGSVAYYFSDLLEMVLAERDLIMGTIIKRPIENLVKYHLKHEKIVI